METESEQSRASSLGYIVPFILFALITSLVEPMFKSQFVAIYCVKVIIVTSAIIYYRKSLCDIRFDGKLAVVSSMLGILLCAVWIVGDRYTPVHFDILGKRTAFNPFTAITNTGERSLFLLFRLFGISVMVPIMEEVFWRSFLLRYITNPEFETVKYDGFSVASMIGSSLFFAMVHPEWLVAFIFSMAMALLLRRTKSLFSCIVAHGVSNITLALYVLYRGAWSFW